MAETSSGRASGLISIEGVVETDEFVTGAAVTVGMLAITGGGGGHRIGGGGAREALLVCEG